MCASPYAESLRQGVTGCHSEGVPTTRMRILFHLSSSLFYISSYFLRIDLSNLLRRLINTRIIFSFSFTRKKKEYPFPRLPSDWGKPLMTHRRKSNKRKNLELSRFIVSPLPHIFNRRLKLVPRDYWREQFACNLQNRPLNRTTKNRKRKGKEKKRSPVSFSVRFFFSIPNSNSTFTRRFSILALLHRPSS